MPTHVCCIQFVLSGWWGGREQAVSCSVFILALMSGLNLQSSTATLQLGRVMTEHGRNQQQEGFNQLDRHDKLTPESPFYLLFPSILAFSFWQVERERQWGYPVSWDFYLTLWVLKPGRTPHQRQAVGWSLCSGAWELAEPWLEQSWQLNLCGLCCNVF